MANVLCLKIEESAFFQSEISLTMSEYFQLNEKKKKKGNTSGYPTFKC